MILSELIKNLEDYKSKLGDVEVFTQDEGFGGYSFSTFGGISEDELTPESCEDSSDEMIKEIFGDKEKIECVVIHTGHILFST